jgi:hypothetical protein
LLVAKKQSAKNAVIEQVNKNAFLKETGSAKSVTNSSRYYKYS